MPSQLRSDTARANGAKSRGPKSAETKEKSSRNSLRHGFTSRHTILLECENEDEFQELEEEFAATHQPATPAEQDLVNEMVAARWRINRIRTIETVIMDCEMVRKKAEVEKTFLQPDSGIHMGMAFRTLAEESRSLSLCNRYESRFSRMYDRAYRTLLQLQRQSADSEDLVRPKCKIDISGPMIAIDHVCEISRVLVPKAGFEGSASLFEQRLPSRWATLPP